MSTTPLGSLQAIAETDACTQEVQRLQADLSTAQKHAAELQKGEVAAAVLVSHSSRHMRCR